MKMTGEQSIPVPRQRAWEALNDPEVLKQCIPGCQSLERDGDDRFKAVVAIKIGPIGARFQGLVSLTDIDAPNAYTLVGDGQGGAAGFAKGSARVRLADEGAGTRLSYDVDAQVGGRMAQLGGAVIDATAKQLAGNFFRKFGEVVGGPPPAAAEPTAATPAAESVAQPAPGPRPEPAAAAAPAAAPPRASAQALRSPGLPIAWILALVVCGMGGFLLGRAGGGAGSDWAGLAVALMVLVAAAAGFEFGRRTGGPVVVLDAELLERLVRRGSGGDA
jgi:carbon monoxide dehydrogenase subunit G